jgi:hypothetical protein
VTDGLTLLNLGTFARVMGRFEEAERWYLRALESVRAAGNFLNQRMVEADLGFLYEQMGHTAAGAPALPSKPSTASPPFPRR